MRLLRLLAAPVAASGIFLAQVISAGPAAADTISDPHCNYDFITFNACLSFGFGADRNTLVPLVGLDSITSESHARDVVADIRSGNAPVFAQLIGDDGPGHEQILANLPISPGWPGAGPGGLGIEWSASLYRGVLDEDKNDQDEVFARVGYWDFQFGWQIFTTGTVHAEFAPIIIIDPPPGCIKVCP
jgi:hypothetical protein